MSIENIFRIAEETKGLPEEVRHTAFEIYLEAMHEYDKFYDVKSLEGVEYTIALIRREKYQLDQAMGYVIDAKKSLILEKSY